MKLLPFNSYTMYCPACRCPMYACGGARVKYSTRTVIASDNGEFLNVTTVGHAPVPHLEKHCPECGFGWLEEVGGDLP